MSGNVPSAMHPEKIQINLCIRTVCSIFTGCLSNSQGCKVSHYENTFIQIYRNFTSKTENVQIKIFDKFHISAQNTRVLNLNSVS